MEEIEHSGSSAATSQLLSDIMDPARGRALQASLGLTPDIAAGMPLPPFFHHCYFWDPVTPDGLGRDGHPARGDILPDLGLPRRMWAGGELQFNAPLVAGKPAEQRSVVEAVTRKQGRSGPLAFVCVRKDIAQDGDVRLTEWQDLVFRTEPEPDAPPPRPPRAPTDEAMAETRRFDTTLLFRYSALTFNGHRIHYDQTYAERVEGYPGLVVHGPLLAQLLMLMAERAQGRPLASVRYRATAPLMHHERAAFCWADGRAWVRAEDGRLCMQAEIS